MIHVLGDDSLATFVHIRIFEIQGGGDCRCTYRLSNRSDCGMLMQWVSFMTVWHQADVPITTVRPMSPVRELNLGQRGMVRDSCGWRLDVGDVSASSLSEHLAPKAST